jgi:hypothetical protein
MIIRAALSPSLTLTAETNKKGDRTKVRSPFMITADTLR